MTTPLILRALAGEETPRRPLWLMRQAGRFLPEYRALRKEHSFEDLCRDPSLAADVTLMPLRRYPFDGAILFADLMTPLASMGVGFRFDPGPVLEKALKTEADIDGLRRPPREEIAKLNLPALILGWTDDPTHPLETAIELDRLLPNSTLVVAKNYAEFESWPKLIGEFVSGINR